MTGRRLGALVLSVVTLAALAACGDADQSVTATRSDEQTAATSPPDTGSGDTVPGDTQPLNTDPSNPLEPTDQTVPQLTPEQHVIDFGTPKTPKDYDDFLDAAFFDITQFWTDNMEATYGIPFEPVAGIFAHYPEREDLPQSCDGPVAYSDVEGNAFYTSCGDIIVYDDAELLPDLVTNLGPAAVGVVAAHEYGHAVQQRAGVFDLGLPTVDTEQQADCFAGAWAAHVARGESDVLTFGDQDVKSGLIAMIQVADPPGIDVVADPSGHGTAFDRVGAFQDGFINGVARCADYPNNPNPRIDLAFNTQEEIDTNGNLPYDQILEAMPKALDTFWVPTLEASNVPFTAPTLLAFTSDNVPACDDKSPDQLVNNATFCQSTNQIAYDDTFVRDLYQRFGDLSFGYPLAVAYSDAVQVALQSQLTGEPRALLNDCLVGAWIDDIIPSGQIDANGNQVANNPNQEILLSSGDLDEAVSTAVALGDEATDTNVVGTAFEKIDSFRAGVLGGLSACQSRIG